ncbi:5'-3' exonuclease PLD4-like isoform X1 [Nothobranchius furzeri]|uniref:5'-3' exonuclease PLD4-like isoform X1 n=1 Tax=Nothobranchius furzeri TaxID=105023 RepID=UPI003904D475
MFFPFRVLHHPSVLSRGSRTWRRFSPQSQRLRNLLMLPSWSIFPPYSSKSPKNDAIRTAAFERKVKVRMLISCGRDSNPAMLPFLQSLASLDYPHHHIHIHIKLFIVPVGNKSDIPFTRINHNKYMVTDKTAYIGTSNWAGDYFVTTARVSLVVSQSNAHPAWRTDALQSQLKEVFNRDWHSQFAVHLDDLGHNPHCALSQ